MGPLESVQTIVITYYQHREDIFAHLESLQASQAVPGEGIFKLLCAHTKCKLMKYMLYRVLEPWIQPKNLYKSMN